MKATLIAVVLLFFVPFQALALEKNGPTPASPPTAQIKKKINLNTANIETLTQSFKGIGKKRAEAIIKYRETHRGFNSITDLAHVKGIGQAFVEKHLTQLKEVFIVE